MFCANLEAGRQSLVQVEPVISEMTESELVYTYEYIFAL